MFKNSVTCPGYMVKVTKEIDGRQRKVCGKGWEKNSKMNPILINQENGTLDYVRQIGKVLKPNGKELRFKQLYH